MDVSEPSSPEEWGAQYAEVRSEYEAYAMKARVLLLELLDHASIDTEAVEARAKGLNSFVKKVQDKGHQYEDPLLEMPDVVGLRIVTYIADDTLKARKVLEENFEIDWDRSSVGFGDGDPDRFGYVSDHFEVRLLPERAALPEWAKLAPTWMEVQVRTVLQHGWAAISHKLQYKAEREVPREHRRQLSRISALLEVADKEFSDLTKAAARLDAQYVSAIEAGDLDIGINADSLAAFLKATQRHLYYSEVAAECGFASFESSLVDERSADWTLVGFPAFVDLVLVGCDMGVSVDLADLNMLLPEPATDEIREGLEEILEESGGRGFLPRALPIHMLTLAYVIALREELDPEEVLLITDFKSELTEAVTSVLEKARLDDQ